MSEPITISNIEVLMPVIRVKGEVLNSNFAEIREAIKNGLSQINLTPTTDEEFGQAKLDTTNLKTVEVALRKAKEETLKQAQDIQNLFSEIDDLSGELSEARLKLEKAVKSQTEKIKQEIFGEAIGKVIAVSSMSFTKRIEDAMKGKRTIKSLQEAAEREVVIINAETKKNREIIYAYEKHQGKSIVLDTNRLELMNEEALRVELESRVQRLKADEEARIAREEAELAKKETARVRAEMEESQKAAPAVPEEHLPLASQPSIPGEEVKNFFDKREPVTPEQGIDEYDEWNTFRDKTHEVFMILKTARAGLVNRRNIERATIFANAVNEGWKGANS